MKVLFKYQQKYINNKTKIKINLDQRISQYNRKLCFVLGFLTKREQRRFHDIVDQIKRSNTNWMKIANIEIN